MKSRVVHGYANRVRDEVSAYMRSTIHTGQVPPAMIRSKDNASGMPLIELDVPER
jgi:hypothetical protein